MLFRFFFKQKTAYELGLGIPAEPLFRSIKHSVDRFVIMLTMTNLSTECLIQLTKLGYDATPFNQILKRSEERRVGKECLARRRQSPQRERKEERRGGHGTGSDAATDQTA